MQAQGLWTEPVPGSHFVSASSWPGETLKTSEFSFAILQDHGKAHKMYKKVPGTC